MSENDIWGGKKLAEEVTIRNYKAPQNIQRYKNNTCGISIESSTQALRPFYSVLSSAGFCVLWFLRVIPSTLLGGLPSGC